MARCPRNKALPGGVSKLSRSAVYRKKAIYKRKKTTTTKVAKPAAAPKTKTIGGAKNGGTRVVAVKEPRYVDDSQIHQLPNRKVARPTKLRTSITPGTVLILLSGPHRGKRVVFLKQLASGLLLITGPFNVNGVPLRRVNQAYVIATSTKVNLTGVKVDDKFNDAYFKRPATKKAAGQFIEDKKEDAKKKVEAGRAADQKAVDALLAKAVAAVPELKFYLQSKFGLSKNEFPHQMKF